MALPSNLYRFEAELTDAETGAWHAVDLRVSRHPSESEDFLVTRVLAWVLHSSEGTLEPSAGVCVGTEPALRLRDAQGRTLLWIDIGLPVAERLDRAAREAVRVVVYSHRDPRTALRRLAGVRLQRPDAVSLVGVPRGLVDGLAAGLGLRNEWGVVRAGDELFVTACGRTLHGVLEPIALGV